MFTELRSGTRRRAESPGELDCDIARSRGRRKILLDDRPYRACRESILRQSLRVKGQDFLRRSALEEQWSESTGTL